MLADLLIGAIAAAALAVGAVIVALYGARRGPGRPAIDASGVTWAAATGPNYPQHAYPFRYDDQTDTVALCGCRPLVRVYRMPAEASRRKCGRCVRMAGELSARAYQPFDRNCHCDD